MACPPVVTMNQWSQAEKNLHWGWGPLFSCFWSARHGTGSSRSWPGRVPLNRLWDGTGCVLPASSDFSQLCDVKGHQACMRPAEKHRASGCGDTHLWPQLLWRLQQEDCLSLGVQNQPGQHSKARVQTEKQKRAWGRALALHS